jgi:hypothetical protein
MLNVINKPCGHSHAIECACASWRGTTWTSTGTKFQAYNGLCECRGHQALHPFHSAPLPPEYVGRHRKAETP